MFDKQIINIRKSNLKTLHRQKAAMGADVTPYILNQINEEIKELRSIQIQLKTRLQLLKEQKAIYGISADPVIEIEIESISEILDNLLHLIEDRPAITKRFVIVIPTHDLMFNIETLEYVTTKSKLNYLQVNEAGLRVFNELASVGYPGDWRALRTRTPFQTVLVFVAKEE